MVHNNKMYLKQFKVLDNRTGKRTGPACFLFSLFICSPLKFFSLFSFHSKLRNDNLKKALVHRQSVKTEVCERTSLQAKTIYQPLHL